MSKPKNQEVGVPNSQILLDIFFRDYDGGVLTDPSPDPTYLIKNPQGVIVKNTTVGVRESTGKWIASYDIPSDAEISDMWSIEWTAFISGSQVPDSWEYFRVTSPASPGFGNDIIISDFWLNQIKKVLAYPSADNLLLNDDEIKTFCVFSAMRDYFVRFPIKTTVQVDVTQNITIDFPDDDTFGVLDLRVVGKSGTLAESSGNSFWGILQYQAFNGTSNSGVGKGSMYGIEGYNPSGLAQTHLMKRQEYASLQNSLNTIDYRIDIPNRNIVVYSSAQSKVLVAWAKQSNDFSKVTFEQQQNVVKLAQANLMRHLADTASIVSDNALDIDINTDELKTKADELEEKVIEIWNEYPHPFVLPMS